MPKWAIYILVGATLWQSFVAWSQYTAIKKAAASLGEKGISLF